jgi:hypothetical protein
MSTLNPEEIFDQYKISAQRARFIRDSCALRGALDTSHLTNIRAWRFSASEIATANGILQQMDGIVKQSNEILRIFQQATRRTWLEDVLKVIGMSQADRAIVLHNAESTAKWHQQIRAALKPFTRLDCHDNKGRLLALPPASPRQISKLLSNIHSRIHLIRIEFIRLEAHIENNPKIAEAICKQMDGLKKEFFFTILSWQAQLLRDHRQSGSKTPIRDRAMPALLGRLDTHIVTEYNLVQREIVKAMNLAPISMDARKQKGNKP